MAGACEDDLENTVTIDEYLEDVEAQELEADLILGGDEGKECTYSKGYMKRQALFSCLTCTPKGDAGVCTACSLACHDGHEIVELWTKRNFRCDCGNSKFGLLYCKLTANKDPENVQNSYNQNFKGTYCTCSLPYPDPNAEEQVEMIQCCICEDWFHENHLGHESSEQIPIDEEGEPLYEDFICQDCSTICSFISLYPQSIRAPTKENSSEKIVSENGPPASASMVETESISCNSEVVSQQVGSALLGEKTEKDMGSKQGGTSVSDATSTGNCILGGLGSCLVACSSHKRKPVFLSKGWREQLCRCGTCVDFYSQKGISYLIDKEDSLEEYEKMAKEKREEKLEQQAGAALNLIDNLGHVGKIEFMNGVAEMYSAIGSFLESHDAANPITSADVHQIFDDLAKKRRRTE